MASKPLISVCVITYNHENFISQAINGVFLQELNFPVEFIISNDCSSDKTNDKIEEIINQAPENISVRYFNHKKNLGSLKNFSFAIWFISVVLPDPTGPENR